ncbi:hypothetical protein SADUNF_Sadunf05G0135600 [Salix dunnii]|uniref:Uncharacterized protein n=1 Tax=Salix dunnii TaxID=1413687 RepID=A0A835K1W9_9ROSI|nr:hypothetical protein SADUNF_Sadunf05G0135600 [Salix dunnii]
MNRHDNYFKAYETWPYESVNIRSHELMFHHDTTLSTFSHSFVSPFLHPPPKIQHQIFIQDNNHGQRARRDAISRGPMFSLQRLSTTKSTAHLTLFLIFSLLSTAAVVYTIACIYTDREVSFNKVMSGVPRVWKHENILPHGNWCVIVKFLGWAGNNIN